MTMTKSQLESHVRAILHQPIPLAHLGHTSWASGKVPLTLELGGIFFALFSHIELFVQADAPHPQTPYFHPINIKIRWYHRDVGENGDTITRFWHEPKNELLTYEQVRQIIHKETISIANSESL